MQKAFFFLKFGDVHTTFSELTMPLKRNDFPKTILVGAMFRCVPVLLIPKVYFNACELQPLTK